MYITKRKQILSYEAFFQKELLTHVKKKRKKKKRTLTIQFNIFNDNNLSENIDNKI